jgi:hypothetical protein
MPVVRVWPATDKTSVKDFRHFNKSNNNSAKDEVKDTKKMDSDTEVEIKTSEEQNTKDSPKNATMITLWREFRENTTLHGLKHARRENKYQLRW